MSQGSGGCKSTIGAPPGPALVRPLWGCGWPPSRWVLTWRKRGGRSVGSLLTGALVPFQRVPPPITPEAPPPTPSHGGLDLHTWAGAQTPGRCPVPPAAAPSPPQLLVSSSLPPCPTEAVTRQVEPRKRLRGSSGREGLCGTPAQAFSSVTGSKGVPTPGGRFEPGKLSSVSPSQEKNRNECVPGTQT